MSEGEAPPARRTPVVLGVIAIISGGVIGAWHGFSLAKQSYLTSSPAKSLTGFGMQPNSPEAVALTNHLHQVLLTLQPYHQALASGMLLLSLALVGVGFGLYRRQPWARPAALLWAALALAFIPVELYVQLAILQPPLQAVFSQAFAHVKDGARLLAITTGAQKGMAIAVQLLFFAPFPILLITLVGRPSAKGDLTGS